MAEKGGVVVRMPVKPMSVNAAYRHSSKRVKSQEYKTYYARLMYTLPPRYALPDGDLHVDFVWGVSRKNADWDNPIKPLQDILQAKYKFVDSRIVFGTALKTIVPTGEEFFAFRFFPYVEQDEKWWLP